VQGPARELGPERALSVKGTRCDVDAQLVEDAAVTVGPERGDRSFVLTVVGHHAEVQSARRTHGDETAAPSHHRRAEAHGQVRLVIDVIDVHVEVTVGGSFADALDAKVRVATRRQ